MPVIVQIVAIAVPVILVLGFLLFRGVIGVREPPVEERKDPWDFSLWTYEEAAAYFNSIALGTPCRVWTTTLYGRHLRLFHIVYGQFGFEHIGSEVPWPPDPGSVVRVTVVLVEEDSSGAPVYLAEVIVEQDGSIPWVYNINTGELNVQPLSEGLMSPEKVALWALDYALRHSPELKQEQ